MHLMLLLCEHDPDMNLLITQMATGCMYVCALTTTISICASGFPDYQDLCCINARHKYIRIRL